MRPKPSLARMYHSFVMQAWGFSRKLFQGFYSEFDLEIVHDSKYVTWMFLTKHLRSNILGAENNSSGGVIFGVTYQIQVICSNPGHIWGNISFMRNIQVTYLESHTNSRLKKQMLEVHNVT